MAMIEQVRAAVNRYMGRAPNLDSLTMADLDRLTPEQINRLVSERVAVENNVAAPDGPEDLGFREGTGEPLPAFETTNLNLKLRDENRRLRDEVALLKARLSGIETRAERLLQIARGHDNGSGLGVT